MAVLTRLMVCLLLLGACVTWAQDATRDLQRVRAEQPSQNDVSAAERVALVIGNSDYEHQPLKNPRNDAEDIAKVLGGLGFEVISTTDANRSEMKRAVRDFGRRLKSSGGVGFFYYAGHGMQRGGVNYLIPVGADIVEETDIEEEAISADWVFGTMDNAGNKLNVVVLDACRNNPVGRSFTRDGTQGLAQSNFRGKIGTFMAYSTAPGSVAKDGNGRNSPYAKHLKAALQTPGLELVKLFRLVGANVEAETKNFQHPWYGGSANNTFYFKPPQGGVPGQVTYTIPQEVDEGIPLSLIASLSLAAVLACVLIYMVRYRKEPEIVTEVVTVDTFAALSRDNLGAMFSAAAVAYLCDSKNGQPMAPILIDKPFLIGRTSKAGLTLHDERVSGRHAELNFDGQIFTVTDLGSSNGTFVDGQRQPPQQACQLPPDGSFYLAEPDLGFSVRYLES